VLELAERLVAYRLAGNDRALKALEMLGSGRSPSSVCRKLGMHPRTVRHYMSTAQRCIGVGMRPALDRLLVKVVRAVVETVEPAFEVTELGRARCRLCGREFKRVNLGFMHRHIMYTHPDQVEQLARKVLEVVKSGGNQARGS
jgi:DNA-binding CsgD family transcriptional regulator